jgi:hypothetical protein
MYAPWYTEKGLFLEHTWGVPIGLVTWAGVAAYADEAYWPLDSFDSWRKRKDTASKIVRVGDVVDAVNAISPIKIAA